MLVTECDFLRMVGNNYILKILAIALIAFDLATSSAEKCQRPSQKNSWILHVA